VRRPGLSDLLLGLATGLSAFAVTTSAGCGTDAVGIDACRDIEIARCEAAQHCGRVDDVAACRRFYRDHCLHGLRTGIEVPPEDEVNRCVATIKKAGECAKGDRQALLDECEPTVTRDSRGADYACDIVLYPEWATECSFLGARGDLPPHPGGGGQGGAP
jgi:hypothetical protein